MRGEADVLPLGSCLRQRTAGHDLRRLDSEVRRPDASVWPVGGREDRGRRSHAPWLDRPVSGPQRGASERRRQPRGVGRHGRRGLEGSGSRFVGVVFTADCVSLGAPRALLLGRCPPGALPSWLRGLDQVLGPDGRHSSEDPGYVYVILVPFLLARRNSQCCPPMAGTAPAVLTSVLNPSCLTCQADARGLTVPATTAVLFDRKP